MAPDLSQNVFSNAHRRSNVGRESDRQPFKEVIYSEISIPEEFVPLDILVDDHKIKAFAFSQDDYNPWCFRRSPFGFAVGHAAILAQDLLLQFTTVYDHDSVIGLHASEELWFASPVRVGETVNATGRYVEKFERRGNGYVVMEGEARGDDGRLLLRHRAAELARIESSTRIGKRSADVGASQIVVSHWPSRRALRRASHRTKTGSTLEPLMKCTTAAQTWVFSSGGEYVRTIHTDRERARSVGFPTPVVQGQQQVCYVSELLTRFFGAAWFTSGWLKMKFIHPLLVGETVRVGGVVDQRVSLEGGVRLELRVWVETLAGVLTSVGWASAVIPAPVDFERPG